MGAKNRVIAGDYMGKSITGVAGAVQICVDFKTLVPLDKFGVDSYDVITEDTRKSAASGPWGCWCRPVGARWYVGGPVRKEQKHRHSCSPFQRRKEQLD